ncbi:MAG: hypothetical protein AAF993_09255 [Pseudomonadota bacterium]
MDLVEKIIACHTRLKAADIPHAFGGALALAWCTAAARGTIDIDINLLAGKERITDVLSALAPEVAHTTKDIKRLQRDLQHRLWWEHTPVDLFFNSTSYHADLSQRVRWEQFAEHRVPFLSCADLAVFKVFFDRSKDWADLEAMRDAGTLDVQFVAGVISHYLGVEDSRLARLMELAGEP